MLNILDPIYIKFNSHHANPSAIFRPGMIGQLKSTPSGQYLCDVCDGTDPLGIFDSTQLAITTVSGLYNIINIYSYISEAETDQYEYNEIYKHGDDLYCSGRGLITSKPNINIINPIIIGTFLSFITPNILRFKLHINHKNLLITPGQLSIIPTTTVTPKPSPNYILGPAQYVGTLPSSTPAPGSIIGVDLAIEKDIESKNAPIKKIYPNGVTCFKCRDFNQYVTESNQEDGTFKCRKCRMGL
jgi:hypothetical protein